MRESVQLVAGLGNPGPEYAKTRHNVGFRLLDAWAGARGLSWRLASEFHGQICTADFEGRRVVFLKPLTYMNDSGRAVGALARYHKLSAVQVAVVCDEINLPFGRAKLTTSGSAGGHNGLASVIAHLGGDFVRYRLGVGPKQPPGIELKDYVLGRLTPEQDSLFTQALPEHLDGLNLLLAAGIDQAMNRINRRPSIHDRSNQENV
ncbi:aminoacyl-tRNA hydrolase [Opitutales bacterium ASA1]|uniref:aminoacyl-tRNA hydrolase n=1 Tax=Congregicoccus parvus TaxID=3081749 RepID=UPI002B2FCB07|nr:aminoacyl-tRNA hydrolase [Opitutales bacterium ASA1]